MYTPESNQCTTDTWKLSCKFYQPQTESIWCTGQNHLQRSCLFICRYYKITRLSEMTAERQIDQVLVSQMDSDKYKKMCKKHAKTKQNWAKRKQQQNINRLQSLTKGHTSSEVKIRPAPWPLQQGGKILLFYPTDGLFMWQSLYISTYLHRIIYLFLIIRYSLLLCTSLFNVTPYWLGFQYIPPQTCLYGYFKWFTLTNVAAGISFWKYNTSQ